MKKSALFSAPGFQKNVKLALLYSILQPIEAHVGNWVCCIRSYNQLKRMSMDFVLRWRIILLDIPATVELSTWISVGGCGWPSSSSVVHIAMASLQLWKAAPSSASAADAITFLMMMHGFKIGAFWNVALLF